VPGYLANPLSLLVRNYRAVDWPQLWIEAPMATCVACCDELVIGSYMIQANQPGLGSDVCNCSYGVSPAARGRGVAAAMCEHSQVEAVRLGSPPCSSTWSG
jgi:hypothetical protein